MDEEVRGYLEMVAISRVFDVEGLWEVLGEVGRDSAGMEEDRSDEEGMEIIIIDNMTHLINELFARKERGEGVFPISCPAVLVPSTHCQNSNP